MLLLSLLAAGCQLERMGERSNQASIAQESTKPPASEYRLTQTEYALIREVNTLRKAKDLAPLTVRLDLSKASRDFAERLSDRTFFDHVSPDGDTPADRADKVDYDWRRLGETLAAGQTTARAAAASWRDSPGHAKIIFDPEHVHIGVGFVRRRSEDMMKPELEHFWVLMAGAPR